MTQSKKRDEKLAKQIEQEKIAQKEAELEAYKKATFKKLTMLTTQSILNLREKLLAQYKKVIKLSDLPVPEEESISWPHDKTRCK